VLGSNLQGSGATIEAESTGTPQTPDQSDRCPPRRRSRAPSFCSQPCRSSVAQMANVQQDNSKAAADAPPVENGQAPAMNPGEDEWDEDRLEKAMNTLKEMHIQVRIPFLMSIALPLIYTTVAWIANYNPQASRASDNQATFTYVLRVPLPSLTYPTLINQT